MHLQVNVLIEWIAEESEPCIERVLWIDSNGRHAAVIDVLDPKALPVLQECEMIEKAPPAPIRIFVVMDDMERPVKVVMASANRMMPKAPTRPAFPTTHPSRRYIITPKMVSTLGV